MAPETQELVIDIPSDTEVAKIRAVAGPVLKNGIKPVHEAFADYMLMNPGATLREMAEVFKYTPAWICTVINSDMFKAYFEGRRQGVEVAILQDLPSKLAAAAHLATEKLIGVLQRTEDPELIVDSFDKILHRHGYAPNAKGLPTQVTTNNTQNNFFLSPGDLADARGKLIQNHQPATVEGEKVSALPAPT